MNEYVESKVGPPGIALAIFGALCLLLNLLGAGIQLLGAVAQIMQLLDAGAGADAWIAWFTSQGFYIVSMMFAVLWGILILVGGLRLRSGRSSALVYFAAFLASFPCCTSWCCCFGLPLGIWVVMTMQDDQVQAAFAEG